MVYGLGRHGWVTIQLSDPSVPGIGVLRDWITESYRMVAPKRLVKLLEEDVGR
jgi:hypothetical protein